MIDALVSKARTLAGKPSDEGLLAPSPVYLTGEEQLRVSTIGNASGVTLTVRGRVLRPDFDIAITEFTHAPNSNRTLASATRTLSEGWPLAFEVKATAGTPQFGAVWCLLELVRGDGAAAVVVESLGYGFVTANQPYQWPNGENFLATDGPGCLRSITGSAPSAGAEISETVPTGARWELIAFRALFSASGTVATRNPGLLLDDGTNTFFETNNNRSVTAGAALTTTWAQGSAFLAAFSTSADLGNLPVNIKLGPGFRIKTHVLSLQGNDSWGAPQFLVREWFDV